jgi:SAM-dependent methyltransferase
MERYDQKTQEYFNAHLTEYPLERMKFALSTIIKYARPDSSLVDIGCGTGNVLEWVKDSTPIQILAGIDNSSNYLMKTCERVQCRTYQGSILDREFINGISERYDFALLGAVLHHLIGRTRRQSRNLAMEAIRNSLYLLKPGGILLIVEPVFYSSFVIDIIFYVKKFLSLISTKRFELRHGYNIGAPVVSYFTNEQLVGMINTLDDAALLDMEIIEQRIRSFPASILKRTNTTLAVKKNS